MRAWVWCSLVAACNAAPEPIVPTSVASGATVAEPAPRRLEHATASAVSAPNPTQAAPEGSSGPELFRRFPSLGDVPWVRLLNGPTPVDRAPGLERALNLAGVFVKRDDVSAPRYGGSKPRKLEFLLGEALARGHRRVVTWGGVGSNQAVATAAHASELGLSTTLLLLPQRATPEVRENLLANVHFGATLELVQSQRRAARLAAAMDAYVIPIGGSSPQGNLGFVNAGLELDAQIRAGELPEPDVVYIPMGTMGSAVGLAIGLAAAGLDTRVVAVRASNLNTSSGELFESVFRATVEYLVALDSTFPAIEFGEVDVVLDGSQLGKGYAMPTSEGRRAVKLAQESERLELENTYTGKALAALVKDASRSNQRTVLFWNTHNSRSLPGDEMDRDQVPNAFGAYLK